LERRQVALIDPLKTVGTHTVRIKLVGQMEAHVKVVIEAEADEDAKPTPVAVEAEAEATAPPAAEDQPEA
jgi:hypothetical protein